MTSHHAPLKTPQRAKAEQSREMQALSWAGDALQYAFKQQAYAATTP
jgi:hypothetical protein